ncbi:uncharacterized protein ColSpa_07783 [Colletotrichum spaethianum]|uniref:BZIP domain-containing protein n=1 Tax=Colletotrichum spaethianum TaxID=700344 RepID=A0AA37P8H9_9PEZI|nr:uncharacterized protein ColSpa_07783 [Colletotrichum spaethianum]GKT47602.1 hypothetical protein ColSpa_07783 [Colletotrichum spaethianum]
MGDFQLNHQGTSERLTYDETSEWASPFSPGGTDAERMQDSVSEDLQPKPSSGSVKSRVNETGSFVEDTINAIKRQRNTIAAQRYRQKGRNRIAELESALKAVEEERDQLKLQLARKEAEVDALREIMRK